MKLGLIGKTLSYSYSKEIFESLDIDYDLIELEENQLEDFFKNNNYDAVNVTIPYKRCVSKYLNEVSNEAEITGVVNAVVNDNGYLSGYNTDYFGFKATLFKYGIEVVDANILILGTGATAQTITYALNEQHPAHIYYATRGATHGDNYNYQELNKISEYIDIIINATPLGTKGMEESLINIDDFPNVYYVVDVVYNPLRSKLLTSAKLKGIRTANGLYMLCYQAMALLHILDANVDVMNMTDSCYNTLMHNHLNYVLIGMPGAGKTTIGKDLAEKLELPFVDTDLLIEEKYNLKINDYLNHDTESSFRKMEEEVIKDIPTPAVIATGGGAILSKDNQYNLIKNGYIIYVRRNNIDAGITNHPLSKTKEEYNKLLEVRLPIYVAMADTTIDNED